MAVQLQIRRGTTAQNATFTGAPGELSIDTDTNSINIHDGLTAGGNNGTVRKTSATGAAAIPVGTTAQAPTGSAGYFRFNSTLNKFVGWINGAWAAIGGGATGGGTDEIFVEMDAVMTQSKTIGDSTYASGVTFTGGSSVIGMTGHSFVVDSLLHYRIEPAGGGALPANVVYDTVYRVIAIGTGTFVMCLNSDLTNTAIVPASAGTSPNQVGKIKHSLIPNPFVQAAGTVLTVEAGTVVTQV